MAAIANILIVDDEPQILRFLRPGLTAGGFNVDSAETGKEAVKMIAGNAPDLVILDLGLPDMDGKEVIQEVRTWSKVPIIVLSARDREAEKIAALDLGADDYVNKPFGIGELLARIRTALRHVKRGSEVSNILRNQGITIDIAAHSVTRDGVRLHLTPKEFDLLTLLVQNAGRVLTHRQILSAIWGPAHVGDMQYLRVLVGQLRQKLGEDPSGPLLILTEPGIGYRFVAEAE